MVSVTCKFDKVLEFTSRVGAHVVHTSTTMACTTIPLTPDRHRPLHTQVTQLREERVSLIEKLDNQKYEIVELKKALQVAAEKQQQAEARADESDERRRRAEEGAPPPRAAPAMVPSRP